MEEEIEQEEWYRNGEKEADVLRAGDYGATVRLQGSSKNISMYTQQGRKGLNQDAMTVWEVIQFNVLISEIYSMFDIFLYYFIICYHLINLLAFIFSTLLASFDQF